MRQPRTLETFQVLDEGTTQSGRIKVGHSKWPKRASKTRGSVATSQRSRQPCASSQNRKVFRNSRATAAH